MQYFALSAVWYTGTNPKRNDMKRIILLAAAVLIACGAVAQTNEPYPSYVQVTGSAEREIDPDEFYLAVTINERDSKGKISIEQQQREMVAALKKLGVDVAAQLKVSDLSSEFFKRKTSVATARYQLRLGSAAEVVAVWQALDALGISEVAIERVSHSRIRELKEEVCVEAVRNARQKAATLAEAIGQKVGRCFYIYDWSSDVTPSYYDNSKIVRVAFATAKGDDEAEELPLDFKTIRLEYSVQTKFVLE